MADAAVRPQEPGRLGGLFDLLPGTPRRVIADMDCAIEAAVASSFPRPGARAPQYQWSDLHVRRALEKRLAPLHGRLATHTVWQRLERALFSAFDWDRFVLAVQDEDGHRTPLPAALRWIATYGPRLRAQASNRAQRGPYSTGAVEAVNFKLANELMGERSNRMGNRARAVKLLDLLSVGLNGRANERGFAKAIRIYLEGRRGRPLLNQRPHDDLKGNPSLCAAVSRGCGHRRPGGGRGWPWERRQGPVSGATNSSTRSAWPSSPGGSAAVPTWRQPRCS